MPKIAVIASSLPHLEDERVLIADSGRSLAIEVMTDNDRARARLAKDDVRELHELLGKWLSET